jgi:hypothetical protein
MSGLFRCSLVAAFLCASGAQADEFTGDQIRSMFFTPQHELELPLCEVGDEVSEYRETDMVTILHYYGKFLAFANIEGDDTPYIMIDRDTLSSVDPVFSAFVLKHECAHLQNGHIDSYPADVREENEGEADCIAARQMRDEGYGRESLSIISTYNRALMQAFFPRSYRDGVADTRNRNITACFDGMELTQ